MSNVVEILFVEIINQPTKIRVHVGFCSVHNTLDSRIYNFASSTIDYNILRHISENLDPYLQLYKLKFSRNHLWKVLYKQCSCRPDQVTNNTLGAMVNCQAFYIIPPPPPFERAVLFVIWWHSEQVFGFKFREPLQVPIMDLGRCQFKNTIVYIWRLELFQMQILYMSSPSGNKHGCHRQFLFLVGRFLKKSSPLKPLGQTNRHLEWSTYGRFCIKFPQNRMKGERHRLSPLSL
jgi:hypothetical protein